MANLSLVREIEDEGNDDGLSLDDDQCEGVEAGFSDDEEDDNDDDPDLWDDLSVAEIRGGASAGTGVCMERNVGVDLTPNGGDIRSIQMREGADLETIKNTIRDSQILNDDWKTSLIRLVYLVKEGKLPIDEFRTIVKESVDYVTLVKRYNFPDEMTSMQFVGGYIIRFIAKQQRAEMARIKAKLDARDKMLVKEGRARRGAEVARRRGGFKVIK